MQGTPFSICSLAGVTRGPDIKNQPHPFGVGHGIAEPDRVEAALQPPEMLGQPERAPRIDRDHLVDAVAEDESAIEHGHARLIEQQKFSIDVGDIAHSGPVVGGGAGAGVTSLPASLHLVKCRLRAAFHRNSIRSASHPRPKTPASGTFSSATTGTSRYGWSSSVSISVPMRSPTRIG